MDIAVPRWGGRRLDRSSASWQVADIGDFNGDGYDDIVWRNDDGSFTNWLGQSNGGFVSNDAHAWTVLTNAWQVQGPDTFWM